MAVGKIRIATEDDAWAVLQQLTERPESMLLGAGQAPVIEIVGWPKFRIRLPKTDKEGEITPTTMAELIEIQKSLTRAYAIVRYNSPDTRHLSRHEREALEFAVVVRQGSSKYEIDLQEIIKHIIDAAAGHMQSEHILIAVLVLGLGYFGKSLIANYLEHRRTLRAAELKADEGRAQLEQMTFMSKEETARMKILAEALARSDEAKGIVEEADDAHRAMLRIAGNNAAGGTLQGITVSGPVASELMTNARRTAEETRITGTFEIQRVDTTPPAGGFLVRLRRISDDLIVNAGVQDDLLSIDHKKIIRDAEWGKVSIICTIKARKVGGNITKAVIVDVAAAPAPRERMETEDDAGNG